MKDKLKSILNKIKNNKKKVIGITFGVFAVFIFTFATYNLNNPTYFNRLFANVLNNGVPANSNFEDNTFYSCVVDAYNNANGTSKAYTDNLTDEELASITNLTCQGYNYSNDDKITSAKGVEKLTGLTTLDLSSNQLASIDLSQNTNLTELKLPNNQLASIDLSNNTSLTNLDLYSNQLTNIDLSNNTSLTNLDLGSNQLASMDLSNNTNLIDLSLHDNLLTSIDINSNTLLMTVDLSNNQLTSIDTSKNIELTRLELGKYINHSRNNISNIDLSNNINLTYLSIAENKLTDINLYNNINLTYLDIGWNNLTSIDLSKNINLEGAVLTENNFFESKISMNIGDVYDVGSNIILPEKYQDSIKYSEYDEKLLKIENGKMTALANGITNFTVRSSLTDNYSYYIQTVNVVVGNVHVFEDSNFNACVVDTYNNKNGTSKSYTAGLTDEELASISNLSCDGLIGRQIYNVNGIEKLINLKSLSLYYQTSLKSLDVSKLLKLESLSLGDCLLKELDVSKNTELKNLYLEGNQLTSLNIDNNIKLERLRLGFSNVSSNSIKELNLSNNINLKELDVSSNGMSYLDLSNNINLESLIINSSVNVNNNTLIQDTNAKELMFIGNKTKLNSSNINIVPPSGMKFSYQSDNENVFDIQNNIITAKASGTANLLVKMGDITIDTKSIRVSPLDISGNYNVNNDVKYINVKDSDALNSDGSINTDILLNNININSDVNIEKNIENNKLILKYNGDKVAEYNIIGYRVINDKLQKYNDSSTGGYKIYMGTKQFDLANDLLLLNCYAEEENDNLVIYDNNKKENVLESIRLLKISSDYYDLDAVYSENDNAYYIYVKDGSLDLNKIQLSTGLTINNDDWRITIKDDPTYGYDTYSYIYPVSLSQSSEYKIIDDAIYIGLTHEDRSHWIGVNHGNAQKNGDKYDIYTNNGVKVATYNIVGLETNYVSYDSEDLGYQYDFNRSSLLLMSDPFNPLQITSKINAETEYSTDTGILKVFYNKKLIDEIKIINVYIPEKYKIVSGALYLRADKFKESLINNITSVNDINKDKINIINAKGIYVNEEEEDHGEIYREERIRIYSLDDEDYDESIGDLEIINVLSNKYDLSNDYIYLGTDEFENDIRLMVGGEEMSTEDLIEENFFKITDNTVELWISDEVCPDNGECYMEHVFMMDSWTKVKASSNKYDLSSDTITLKDDEVLDLNSITIKNGTIILEGDTLVIKCNDKIVKEIKVKGGKKVTTKPSTTSDNKITTKNNVTTTSKTTQKRIGNIFDRLRKRTTTKKVTTTKKSTIKIIKRTTSNKAIIATTKNNVDINSKESGLFKKTGTKVLISLLVLLGILLSGILYYIKKNNRE